MDVGTTSGWRRAEVVPAADLVARIDAEMPLLPLEPNYDGEVARRYAYADGEGEIGFITSVTQPFCGDCTRARLTAEGQLYTCLFAVEGNGLRDPMRAGASDEEIERIIRGVWERRTDRYSEIRSGRSADLPRIEMSYIGG